MEEQYRKIEWQEDDVIGFYDDQVRKADSTLESLKESIQYNNWGQNLNDKFSHNLRLNNIKIIPGDSLNRFSQWFEEGVDCEIMRAYDTKGWRRGKIRVKLNIEFELWEETEEADSPLDNFRNGES
ncbi:hypothetical protein FRE64_05555 [Euhalothece natronophila Z-M001]|uniref:KGK domain-containing protein n=1 Tax=Euhalothece natronophila Z-M001 TaxID=522448 RepID=A0A5B8NMC6_9CHRO|nr:KGK domain-containing protein [Euhalothece natronophila]QDZ39435.1 hypothetical protein FRE64_05555 [Euhalothece natronophila Z-M001]